MTNKSAAARATAMIFVGPPIPPLRCGMNKQADWLRNDEPKGLILIWNGQRRKQMRDSYFVRDGGFEDGGGRSQASSSEWPSWWAQSAGVPCQRRSFLLRSAPRSTRRWTISSWPARAAWWSGVECAWPPGGL